MTNEETIHKLEFIRNGYQKLIDEKVDSGKFVGAGIQGEWKSNTPLDKVYTDMIEALDMAIKALEQQPCEDCISRQAVLELAEKGNLVGNSNYESVCKAINNLLSVKPKRTRGKWVVNKQLGGRYQCSKCGMFSGLDRDDIEEGYKLPNYCSDCGAKMESEGKECNFMVAKSEE